MILVYVPACEHDNAYLHVNMILVYVPACEHDIPSLYMQIWSDINSGEAVKNPRLLNRFFLLTFSVSF